MSAIQIMQAQPWVERLGSTLLHFLWEGVAIAAVYAVGRRWTERGVGPHARYIVACVALTPRPSSPRRSCSWLCTSSRSSSWRMSACRRAFMFMHRDERVYTSGEAATSTQSGQVSIIA